MKNILYLNLLVLTILSVLARDISIYKGMLLCISLNKDYFDAFGLPLKSSMDEFNVQLNPLDTQSVKVENGTIFFKPLKNDSLFFFYKSKNIEINGCFLIPKFTEIRYASTIDPETFLTVEIFPIPCYCPVRIGRWVIKENKNIEIVEYKTMINMKSLKE